MGAPVASLNHKEYFVRQYALYMAGERRKEQEASERSGVTAIIVPGGIAARLLMTCAVYCQGRWSAATRPRTRSWGSLWLTWERALSTASWTPSACTCASLVVQRNQYACLADMRFQGTAIDSLHLTSSCGRYGLCLKASGAKEEARARLVDAVRGCPLNWSAWLDLASLCGAQDVRQR